MEQTPQISEQTLETLIAKYKWVFETRFPKLTLSVHFTLNGRAPDEPEAAEATGSFSNEGKDYRICIKQHQIVALQILTFFHEFGHALYRREANEIIDNMPALIRAETAALKKSLELADTEGLPQIGRLAVVGAKLAAMASTEYHEAMNNVKDSPLWLKYS
jgi:hypothetical protein